MTLHNPRGRPRKYRFHSMIPGDRQFHPLEGGTIRDLQNRLKTSAGKHGTFTTKRISKGGALGVVVERVYS